MAQAALEYWRVRQRHTESPGKWRFEVFETFARIACNFAGKVFLVYRRAPNSPAERSMNLRTGR